MVSKELIDQLKGIESDLNDASDLVAEAGARLSNHQAVYSALDEAYEAVHEALRLASAEEEE